jgi:hypothetical protein
VRFGSKENCPKLIRAANEANAQSTNRGRVIRYAAFLLVASLAACASSGAVPSAGTAGPSRAAASRGTYVAGNDVPPRHQWLANFGYCGETSFVAAGLYYGQYVSQYEARAIASGGVPQNRARSQLLLGVNDLSAAAKMHLAAIEWNVGGERSTNQFLAWVKNNVVLGRPVVIGVYTNEYRFYGKTDPKSGDAEYDHIVPVTAVDSANPLKGAVYYPGDGLTFSDNGLWGTPSRTPYLFHYTFQSFQKSRVEANAKGGTVYSLANDGRNYGIAITGVKDRQRETLAVRVATNVNYERPVMLDGSTVRPRSMPLVLTVTVSGLRPGVTYRVYRYDNFADVPDDAFNANASKAAQRRTVRIASGSTYGFSDRIKSDGVAVYRAVAASSP